ncbi:hypothetical protein, partial [Mycolicibacterium porcinum]|uniref:hypothetical protein n=2 Tax=Mycolicibacterium porcinum TaxID=39693 RepID=UPI002265BE3E
MSTDETAAGKHLSKTSLRNFGPPVPQRDRDYRQPAYTIAIPRDEAPIPVLLRYALTLVGIPHFGPGEKVEWWTTFTYRNYPCELAHQKFGVRLRIGGNLTEERALALLSEMRRKLSSAVKAVEKLRWALRSGPVVVGLCCPSVRAGRIDDDMAGSKR